MRRALVAAALAAGVWSVQAAAQEPRAPQMAVPRTADGKPDLTKLSVPGLHCLHERAQERSAAKEPGTKAKCRHERRSIGIHAQPLPVPEPLRALADPDSGPGQRSEGALPAIVEDADLTFHEL